MNLEEFMDKQINEGWKGERGVPDGSGPAPGEAGKGRKIGNCPKREDFETEEEYKKALATWKKNQ